MLLVLACAPRELSSATVGSPSDASGALLGGAPDREVGSAIRPIGGTLWVRGASGLSELPEPESPATLADVATATVPTGWASAGLGDLDGDGAIDVVALDVNEWDYEDCSYSVTVDVFRGPFSGTVTTSTARYAGGYSSCDASPAASLVGDVDGDGADDYLLALASGSLQRFPADATGELLDVPTWLTLDAFEPDPQAAGDLDGDGVDDLLLLGRRHGAPGVAWLLFGPVTEGTATADVVFPAMTSATPGDLDGDGADDLLTHEPDGLHARHADGQTFATLADPAGSYFAASAIGGSSGQPLLAVTTPDGVYELRGPFSGTMDLEDATRWAYDDDTFGRALAFSGERLYVGDWQFSDDWSREGAVFWFE